MFYNNLATHKHRMSERELMLHNPTLIRTVGHFRFYEDPELGDEGPLLLVNVGGDMPAQSNPVYVSAFWDAPSYDEVYS